MASQGPIARIHSLMLHHSLTSKVAVASALFGLIVPPLTFADCCCKQRQADAEAICCQSRPEVPTRDEQPSSPDKESCCCPNEEATEQLATCQPSRQLTQRDECRCKTHGVSFIPSVKPRHHKPVLMCVETRSTSNTNYDLFHNESPQHAYATGPPARVLYSVWLN